MSCAIKEEYKEGLQRWTKNWSWQIPCSIKSNLDLLCPDSGAMGEELSSIASGKKGGASGGSGFDLVDKKRKKADEVKLALWVQSSKCQNCEEKVLFWHSQCNHCGSLNLKIKADSRWGIDARATVLYKEILEYYHLMIVTPKEYVSSCRTFTFSHFVIKGSNDYFCQYIENQFYGSTKSNNCNLLPYSYDFYMCEPIKIIESTIMVKEEDVEINYFDLDSKVPEPMDINKLKSKELKILLDSKGVEYKSNSNLSKLKKIVGDEFLTGIPTELLFLRKKNLNKNRGNTSRKM